MVARLDCGAKLKYLLLAASLGPVTSALTQPELFTKATA